MTEFYNPYQFIEFTGKVNGEDVKTTPFSEISKGHTEARHDYWLSSPDYHSGRILCQIDLLSPTITGNIHDKEAKKPACIVKQYRYKDQLAIQANSLRGMIANILELLSQSALRILSDKTYRVSDNRKVVDFNGTTFDFFKANGHSGKNKNYRNALPWGNDRTELTPAETLLGVVKDENDPDHKNIISANLASRIRFSDALGKDIKLHDQLLPLKILGSPKPSESGSKADKNKGTPTACMYFKPRGGSGYIAKTELTKDLHEANGRKFYLPHPANTKPHWQANISGKDDNAKQRIYCTPLAAGSSLYFHIDFNNLSTDELVLLQTSLKPSPRHQHSIGLGKPLGLGQINLTLLATFFINRQQRYSLQALTTARYTAVQTQQSQLPECLQERYPHECHAIATAPKTKLANTSPLIDQETLALLQRLGNPEQQKNGIAICFPYDEDKGQTPHNEKESFKWFVENNKQSKEKAQYLPTLNAMQEIPTLNSSHRQHRQKTTTSKSTPAKTDAELPPIPANCLILSNLPACHTEQEKIAIEQAIKEYFADFTITLHLPDPVDNQAYIAMPKKDLDDAYKESLKYPLTINNQRINLIKT